ncbi:ArsR family transcriptional regulator [Rudaeicoccus suwonensis]|uniref:ArsR family transcriptional regulator n=2 Tax=Rudaeicoccus suwonensis TaxID=657409 RepID=A0A561E0W8_9MICO|nr:ArsR family transcriptional regulator [Rudaeicoccus suwonensis]
MHNYCARMPQSPTRSSEDASATQVATQSPLRALAHPLRSRLLAQLKVHGEATATQLAVALDTHTGATSYHLRKLAEAGLIADTGTGTGRRRVWRAVDPPRRADPAEPLDEDEAAAAEWLQRDYIEHFAERAGAWVSAAPTWPATWQEHCGLDDHAVLVTTEQLTALSAELAEVLDRYRRAGAGTPGARRVAAYTALLPIDPPPGS